QTAGAEVLFGLFQGGQVAWNEPALISFGDGSQLRITLSNADFNWGMFGTMPGERHGALITANFELISDSAAVIPLPAGLPLLLSGIGGLALLRRRRNAAVA
ncbi:MAG TPA: VPLPA-CTERM sorting domain-containing protein, partial [Paracoccaceae bacterium]|nr:VPLPA-CTERM sorting domain-containing protein [Paracoccaceae bacterium]